MMSSPSFARRVGGWDVNTLSEGSMQIRYTSMFLLRYYEEIPNFLSGNRNFFFIYYEEIHRIGYKPVQRAKHNKARESQREKRVFEKSWKTTKLEE